MSTYGEEEVIIHKIIIVGVIVLTFSGMCDVHIDLYAGERLNAYKIQNTLAIVLMFSEVGARMSRRACEF